MWCGAPKRPGFPEIGRGVFAKFIIRADRNASDRRFLAGDVVA
jgi:hypothetical protein